MTLINMRGLGMQFAEPLFANLNLTIGPGDRIGWVLDPSGHMWTVATRVEETSEEQRRERWSSIRSTSD